MLDCIAAPACVFAQLHNDVNAVRTSRFVPDSHYWHPSWRLPSGWWRRQGNAGLTIQLKLARRPGWGETSVLLSPRMWMLPNSVSLTLFVIQTKHLKNCLLSNLFTRKRAKRVSVTQKGCEKLDSLEYFKIHVSCFSYHFSIDERPLSPQRAAKRARRIWMIWNKSWTSTTTRSRSKNSTSDWEPIPKR